jgi:hypothetical protein
MASARDTMCKSRRNVSLWTLINGTWQCHSPGCRYVRTVCKCKAGTEKFCAAGPAGIALAGPEFCGWHASPLARSRCMRRVHVAVCVVFCVVAWLVVEVDQANKGSRWTKDSEPKLPRSVRESRSSSIYCQKISYWELAATLPRCPLMPELAIGSLYSRYVRSGPLNDSDILSH